MRKLILVLCSLMIVAMNAQAVDVYDGVRAPPGTYFINYLSYYYADTLTGSSGNTRVGDFDFHSVYEIPRIAWYTKHTMLTVLAPFGYKTGGALDDSASGLGDVVVAGGGFLPIEKVDVLALLATDVPTGEFDETAALNMGTGQWDIRPALYVHKEVKPYTFDGVAKYNFRLENDDTNLDPGDEVHLEAMGTYEINGVKVGPSVKWLKGRDNELDGATVPDSARQILSVGVESWMYRGGWSVVLNYMADAYVENSTRGHLFRFKLVKKL